MADLLKIYLNDQIALGVGWRELARRSSRANRGGDAEAALADVARAVAEDVATFRRIMLALGYRPSVVKPALAMAAERVGRLKLNGALARYSPLSRFSELEYLAMGVDRKRQLWTTLRDIAGLDRRLPDVDFDLLIERAERQRDALEPYRVEAGITALRVKARTRRGPVAARRGPDRPGRREASTSDIHSGRP